MSALEPSDEEVSSLVLAAEGVLTELTILSQSSDEQGLLASAEEVLAEGSGSVCCQFTERVNSTQIESAVSLLEIALSSEIPV